MNIDLFDFDLPEALIAQTPLNNRLGSRLLTLNKVTGETSHRSFTDLIDYLQPGDTLVLNDTKVLPARIFGIKQSTGAKVELLLLKSLGDDRWETLVRPGKRIKHGDILLFGSLTDENTCLTAVVEEESTMGRRVIRFTYQGIFPEILDRLGQMPLPPYIKVQLSDKSRYQTVYANAEGSAAAPTAGLHFTKDYLKEIEHKGVSIAYLTLHVGLGTFRPVSVETVEQHEMHEEYYALTSENANILNTARARKSRIIAVGTTSARTLETLSLQTQGRDIIACQGWTSIFIYPGYTFQLVDVLLTNFHLPKSTLVMLVSALAGRENVIRAYQEAIKEEYRFFSFGDAMLVY